MQQMVPCVVHLWSSTVCCWRTVLSIEDCVVKGGSLVWLAGKCAKTHLLKVFLGTLPYTPVCECRPVIEWGGEEFNLGMVQLNQDTIYIKTKHVQSITDLIFIFF